MTSEAKTCMKKCSHPRCTNKAVQANVCRRHGAPTKRCSEPTCNNVPVKGGVCQRHGAKKKKCNYPTCTNICQKWGVCRKHGAEPTRCSQANCSNKAVNGGVCCRHGAKLKKCNYANCPNLSTKGGFCRRHVKITTKSSEQVELADGVYSNHDVCTRTDYSLPEQERNDDTCANNCSLPETEHVSDRLTVCHSLLSLVGTNDFERNIASGTQQAQNQRSRDSREIDEIDVDTILQVPHYVSDNFRKQRMASKIKSTFAARRSNGASCSLLRPRVAD